MDKLMKGLGLGSGYIAQGGDIGSFVARVLYTTDESCKAIHSMFTLPCPNADLSEIDETLEVY